MTRSLRFHTPKPRRAKAKRPEASLQKAVVAHLRLTGAPGMFYFSIPNEGKRSAAACAELKLMGMRPGAADLCIVIDGRAHFMEFKSLSGVQGAYQVGFQLSCFDARCPYELVNNIDDALRVLTAWGAIRARARAA